MSTFVGRSVEEAVAEWLKDTRKWNLLDSNWRSDKSEIDLIMKHKYTVHFIEVKYRQRADSGAGYEYITVSKQQKLRLGAAAWLRDNGWDKDYQIDVVSAAGDLARLDFDLYENAVIQD